MFIDEIDAVGMRRAALGGGAGGLAGGHEPSPDTTGPFYGSLGRPDRTATSCSRRARGATACSPSARRARRPIYPPAARAIQPAASTSSSSPGMMGGQGGGHGAQPAAGADGRHRRPAVHAQALPHQPHQHVPRRALLRPAADRQAATAPARRRSRARSRSTSSAPATCRSSRSTRRSSRPGRMGRHIYFRTPTREDRRDIFDLYMAKVDHEPDARHASAAATSWRASPTATRRR